MTIYKFKIFGKIGLKNQILYFQVFLKILDKKWIFRTAWHIFLNILSLSLTVPRILVVTGWGHNNEQTELWPKPDSQCALPNFPLNVGGTVGFWTAQGPSVCGSRGDKCFLYKENQWMPWINMGTTRYYASALEITPNQALIIGGRDENRNKLKTTELISSSGSEEGIKFPVTINAHCSFKINATHGIVTGGWQDGYTSANTWYVDLTTTTVTPGPTMKTNRRFHGCSIVQHGTKSFGIVAGGFGKDSTEMINLDQESPEWTEGIQDKSKIVCL